MEKFSNFHDPVTGVNPFGSLKLSTLNYANIFHFMQKIPFFILFLFGFNTIPLLIKVKTNKIFNGKKLICNSVSLFDKYILKYIYPSYQQFTNVNDFLKSKKPSICFIEECKSNGLMLLKFQKYIDCDGCIFLKYSNECVFTSGPKYLFYLNFLSRKSTIDVEIHQIKNSSDFSKAVNVPQSRFGITEKLKYCKLLINQSNINNNIN